MSFFSLFRVSRQKMLQCMLISKKVVLASRVLRFGLCAVQPDTNCLPNYTINCRPREQPTKRRWSGNRLASKHNMKQKHHLCIYKHYIEFAHSSPMMQHALPTNVSVIKLHLFWNTDNTAIFLTPMNFFTQSSSALVIYVRWKAFKSLVKGTSHSQLQINFITDAI